MNKKCCDQLDDFLDGDLSPEDRELFLEIASSCADCQEAILSHREIYSLLKTGWNDVSAPELEWQLVSVDEKDSGSISSQPRLAMGWFGNIAAVFVLALVGYWLITSLLPQIGNVPQDGEGNELIAKDETVPGNENNQTQENKKDSSNDDIQLNLASNKATVQLSDSHLGLRLDEPDDGFTLIQVYQTVQPSSFPDSNSQQLEPNDSL